MALRKKKEKEVVEEKVTQVQESEPVITGKKSVKGT